MSCGLCPNQNFGEDESVIVFDEHTVAWHRLQRLAETDVAVDRVLFKDGRDVFNKCCRQIRGRAEAGEASLLNLPGPSWPLRRLDKPFVPR